MLAYFTTVGMFLSAGCLPCLAVINSLQERRVAGMTASGSCGEMPFFEGCLISRPVKRLLDDLHASVQRDQMPSYSRDRVLLEAIDSSI